MGWIWQPHSPSQLWPNSALSEVKKQARRWTGAPVEDGHWWKFGKWTCGKRGGWGQTPTGVLLVRWVLREWAKRTSDHLGLSSEEQS